MKRLFIILVSLLALAACNTNPPSTAQPPANPIDWDRKPDTIVFRADVLGGDQSFVSRSEVPPCTIYGDNLVVWTNEISSYEVQTLYDKVGDEQIRRFVSYLTIGEKFYNYKAKADVQPASSTSPVVETLTLFINNVTQKVDAFSGWDVDYYSRVLRNCKGISAAPVLYVPKAAWVSAQKVDYDPTYPKVNWDAKANALSLADLATKKERKWITDRNVAVLWNLLHTSPPNTQFTEDDVQYEVALEVPGFTRMSPPAPAS
jgi:hypothetical protein